MRVLKFELKKIWKQKKLYWIFAIVLLVTSGVFFHNNLEKEDIDLRALEEFESFVLETELMGDMFRLKQSEDGLSESEQKQYDHIKQISTAFFHWKRSINEGLWEEIPIYENEFLSHLKQFEGHGGIYSPLQGVEREIRIAKNDWMIKHDLSYEDTVYPTSPHLILKEASQILLGILGIVILFLFFGNTITSEKEQNTWMTLRTQPIPKWKLFVSKYISLLFTTLVFIFIVVFVGILIPLIVGDSPLSLSYPQIVSSGEDFEVVSTLHYVTCIVLLFICAMAFTFSCILLISKWIKHSFTTLILTSFILIIGYIMTDSNTIFQSIWNPFYLFHMESIIETVPIKHLIFVIATLLWCLFFVFITIIIPEKQFRIFGFLNEARPFHNGITKSKGHDLKKSMQFESRKTRRKGFLYQVSIVICLLLGVGYTLLYQATIEKERNYIDILHETLKSIEEAIPEKENEIFRLEKVAKEDEDLNASLLADSEKRYLAFYQKDVALLKKAIDGYKQDDWLPILEYQLFRNKEWNGDFDEDLGRESYKQSYISNMTIDASIKEKEWLLEEDIQPVYSGAFVKTMFDEIEEINRSDKFFVDYWNEWEEENEKLDSSGLYSLYHYFNISLYIIPVVLVLFLFGGGLADERGKKNTIHFLRTQPVTQRSLFTGKVAYSIGISILSSIGLIMFVILIGTIFDRFGDWYYPILHYDSKSIVDAANYLGNIPSGMEVGYHFVSLGDVLLKNIALFLCMLVFILTIAHVLSLWFKNKLTVLASAIIIIVIGYVMSANLLENKAHLSPFTYFDISRITNGEIATILDNPAVNVQYGVVVQLVSIVIFLIVGYLSLLIKEKRS